MSDPALFRCWCVLGLFLLLQAGFWWQTSAQRPRMEVVPAVPGTASLDALSFGDRQFLFRAVALQMQNFGDLFGRFTPLQNYDYAKLRQWFGLADLLDDRSGYVPALAGYYFSKTQKREDVRYVVDYLRARAEARLDTEWWWQVQAVYLAAHRLEDNDLALAAALPLQHARNVPVWVNQLPAFIYEKRGEYADALAIMEAVRDHGENLSAGELKFINDFIAERLRSLEGELSQSPEKASSHD